MRRRYGVDSGVARHVGTDSSAVGARELVPAFRRPVCRDRHRRTQPNAPHGPSRSRTRYESSCQPNRLPSPRRIPNPQQADTRCRTDLPLACSVYRFRSRRQCSERRSRRDATWHSPESCYHMVARANSPLGADQCRRLHVIGSDNRSQDSERPKADLVNEYRRLRKFMSVGNKSFFALMEFAEGRDQRFPRPASGLTIRAYFFEKCEVQER